MNIKTLLSTDTNTTGSTFDMRRDITRNRSGIVQVSGIDSDTCTVTLEGRLSSASDWFTIATITADEAKACLLFPDMRAVTASNTATLVTVEIGA